MILPARARCRRPPAASDEIGAEPWLRERVGRSAQRARRREHERPPAERAPHGRERRRPAPRKRPRRGRLPPERPRPARRLRSGRRRRSQLRNAPRQRSLRRSAQPRQRKKSQQRSAVAAKKPVVTVAAPKPDGPGAEAGSASSATSRAPPVHPNLQWPRPCRRGLPHQWAWACRRVPPAARQRPGLPPAAACRAQVRPRARSLIGRPGRETTTTCS